MRAMFGVVGLLLVLVIVGLLAKTQLKAVGSTKVPALSASAASGSVSPAGVQVNPDGNVQQQSQQIQQQFKTMADAAVQTPRAMPDDK
jgi:hypothetical protein